MQSDGSRSPQLIPADPGLPGLELAFDPDGVMDALAGRATGADPPEKVRITYVRYKPGTSCVVAYAFAFRGAEPPLAGYAKVYGDSDFEIALAKVADRRWQGERGLPAYLVLERERLILFFYPHDAELPGLRLFANPKGMQRALYAHVRHRFPEDRWRISDSRLRVSLVRYKPEKRAVLRVETKAIERDGEERRNLVVYGRAYTAGLAAGRFDAMRSLEEQASVRGVRVPTALACLPSEGVILVDCLAGAPVTVPVLGADGSLPARIGAALHRVHQCRPRGVERLARAKIMDGCAATAASIAAVAPGLAEPARRVTETLRRLSARVPAGEEGLVHGDFHPGQILADGEDVGLLDFDRAHLGEVDEDLGNFRAHLLAAGGMDAGACDAVMEAMFAAHGRGWRRDSRATGFWTATGLINLAVQPFRTQEPAWHEQMSARLSLCEAILR